MSGCTLLGHFICNAKCMGLKSPQNEMVKSNLIISKFSHKKETLEMDELSQNVSVEMELISEKRLFINLFLSVLPKQALTANVLWVWRFFFTQRQMKETNLWCSDSGVCWVTSNDLFAPCDKNLKGLLCPGNKKSNDIPKLSFKISPLQQNLLPYD